MTAWGVKKDVVRNQEIISIRLPIVVALVYLLHNNAYFRSLFYYRIGPVKELLISWIRPGDKHFMLSRTMRMGSGCMPVHSFATVLNAERIGNNFVCRNNTTVGYGNGGRPVIGDNVDLGVNVVIIGGIKVGSNVIVGAGSVVVKDVPDNCVVAGNPAKIIRYLN